MRNGFLDDMPNIDLPEGGRRGKKRKQRPCPESPDLPVVYWRRVRCPRCDSDKVPVTSSTKPIRYHKCRECGLNFKSVQECEIK